MAAKPSPAHVRFWLRELRTPEILIPLADDHARVARRVAASRPPVAVAVSGGDERAVERALLAEETAERDLDRRYWLPLRAELERLRRAR